MSDVRFTEGKAVSLAKTELLGVPKQGRQIEDAYPRGADFVVSIPEDDRTPFGMQVYWRAIEELHYFGFEAIVSVQTSQFEVAPELDLKTRSDQPCSTVDARGALIAVPNADITYFEIAHSSNLDSTQVDDHEITHHLFSGHLEKGVIRCARIRGLFLPLDRADCLIPDICERLERSAPPLTT